KPNARYFAVTILAVGLILRGLVQERRMKKEAAPLLPASAPVQLTRSESALSDAGTGEAILCAIRGTGRTLDFALREARETGRRRNALVNILRGNLVREVSDLLPEEIDLLVYA